MTKKQQKEYNARYYKKHRKEALAKQKQYRRSPKGKARIKAYQKTAKYKAKEKKFRSSVKHKAYQKKYQKTVEYKVWLKHYRHTAVRKAYQKNYMKKYHQSDKCKAYQTKYRHSDKAKALARARYRQDVNRAKALAKASGYTAKRFGAPGAWTGSQFLALCKKHGNVCLCCRRKRNLGPDHVVPFCKGGTNHLSNIQPLCLPCNVKKARKTTDYRLSTTQNTATQLNKAA